MDNTIDESTFVDLCDLWQQFGRYYGIPLATPLLLYLRSVRFLFSRSPWSDRLFAYLRASNATNEQEHNILQQRNPGCHVVVNQNCGWDGQTPLSFLGIKLNESTSNDQKPRRAAMACRQRSERRDNFYTAATNSTTQQGSWQSSGTRTKSKLDRFDCKSAATKDY